jgi:YgiT-type zinc finger domain-containing protein
MKRATPSRPAKLPEEIQCTACGGRSFTKKTVTFPFPLPFGGKIIDVAGVQVQECRNCHEWTPTYEGRRKLARCLEAFMSLPG